MPRPVALALAWLAVAAVAITVAWQGVSVVGDQVTDERPAPLTAGEIERRLVDDEGAATTTVPPASTTSTPTTTESGGPTGGPAPTTAATSPSPPAPTTTTSPPPPPPPAETRTYNLVGGTASLRFSPEGVTVVFANPAPGFSVETEPEHGNGVKVEFESDTHRSRVDGWWDGGPVDRVREDEG